MRRMRNPPHDVQTKSKVLSKSPLTKDGYTKGAKGLYKYNNSWPCKPKPRMYISKDRVLKCLYSKPKKKHRNKANSTSSLASSKCFKKS